MHMRILLRRLSRSWTVLLPNDTYRKPITSITVSITLVHRSRIYYTQKMEAIRSSETSLTKYLHGATSQKTPFFKYCINCINLYCFHFTTCFGHLWPSSGELFYIHTLVLLLLFQWPMQGKQLPTSRYPFMRYGLTPCRRTFFLPRSQMGMIRLISKNTFFRFLHVVLLLKL
jgi:hypothetical protein